MSDAAAYTFDRGTRTGFDMATEAHAYRRTRRASQNWEVATVSDAITMRLTHPTIPAGRVEGFSLIWAFYVKGFTAEKHCQFCFKGLRAPNFHSRNAASGVDVVLDRLDVSPVVYICGVAKGPDSERRVRNFHLPVRFEPGATLTATTYNGYTVEVENAAPLAIPPVPDGWQGLPTRHTRCKNFQFGLAHFGGGAGGNQSA